MTTVKSFSGGQQVDKFIAKILGEKVKKGYVEESASSIGEAVQKRGKSTASVPDNSFSSEFLSMFWNLELEPNVKEEVTEAAVAQTESDLGYKLPAAYIELMKSRNGGWPTNTVCSELADVSQSYDIDSFIGIGFSGDNLSHAVANWIDEWEYPQIGVYFGNCPSGGHDLIAMDFTQCGPKGEPRIVHVDQEGDYFITVLANSFEEYVLKLKPYRDDEHEAEAKAEAEAKQKAKVSSESGELEEEGYCCTS